MFVLVSVPPLPVTLPLVSVSVSMVSLLDPIANVAPLTFIFVLSLMRLLPPRENVPASNRTVFDGVLRPVALIVAVPVALRNMSPPPVDAASRLVTAIRSGFAEEPIALPVMAVVNMLSVTAVTSVPLASALIWLPPPALTRETLPPLASSEPPLKSMIDPPPVFRFILAGSRLRVIAALILMVTLELLLLPICKVSHVTRSSSASVRPSCPAVFVPRSIDRDAVCGLKVTVPAETNVLVGSSATSSAVNVITPAPDVVRSAPAPVETDSALTIKLLPAVNVMSPLRFTASMPASPLIVRLGNVPVKAPTFAVSLPLP